jgi:D-3-phosphoglycerate dehydrogenase
MSKPRLTEIFGITVEADLAGDMLYIVNEDKPGFIGRLGSTLGGSDVNIGTFHLGRRDAGGEAVLLLSVDNAIPDALLTTIRALPGVKVASALRFV